MRLAGLAAACVLGLACAQVDSPEPDPVLPADYQTTFATVRDCRASTDHQAPYGTVRVDPALVDRYQGGPYPFPVGAVVVKEEFMDARCMQLVRWTVMKKEQPGHDPASGDWSWYVLDRLQRPVEAGKLARCAACHEACRGRDFTCAPP